MLFSWRCQFANVFTAAIVQGTIGPQALHACKAFPPSVSVLVEWLPHRGTHESKVCESSRSQKPPERNGIMRKHQSELARSVRG